MFTYISRLPKNFNQVVYSIEVFAYSFYWQHTAHIWEDLHQLYSQIGRAQQRQLTAILVYKTVMLDYIT